MNARIVGIINVTPDSFSDAGLCENPSDAVRHGLDLLRDGADELDVGGESTRPDAAPVSGEEEQARVVPVIEGLRAAGVTAAISIDTFRVDTARAALAAGADGINDITGFRDPELRALAAETGARCIVMYGPANGRPGPEDEPRPDLTVVMVFLQGQALLLNEAGVAPERIAVDPGFGFTGSRDDDIKLFGQLLGPGAWHATHLAPLYVGLSRKRFLRRLFGADLPLSELDQASAELSVATGARYLRVHDASATYRERERFMTQPPQTAYVALGSNIEPCEEHLRAALDALAALPATTLDAVAPTYLSAPAYDQDQAPFYNTVARLSTHLGPRALFAALQAYERSAGRQKTRVNGPRSIDLDLLSQGDAIIETKALTIPHPRISERAFVVEPLLAVDPDYRFPTGQRLTREAERYGAIIKVRPALAPDQSH